MAEQSKRVAAAKKKKKQRRQPETPLSRKKRGRDAKQKFADYVVEESRKGNVVFAALDGYAVAPLDEFIKQPADGILYDLNRLPEVVLTFIDDRKWVNDFAVSMVIKRLRELIAEWENSMGAWGPIDTAPKDGKRILLANTKDAGSAIGIAKSKRRAGSVGDLRTRICSASRSCLVPNQRILCRYQIHQRLKTKCQNQTLNY